MLRDLKNGRSIKVENLKNKRSKKVKDLKNGKSRKLNKCIDFDFHRCLFHIPEFKKGFIILNHIFIILYSNIYDNNKLFSI